MLEAVCRYAIDNGLPYEFVDYAIDVWGALDLDTVVDLTAVHHAWNEGAN